MGQRLRRTVALVTALATGALLLTDAAPRPAGADPVDPPAYSCDVDGDGTAETAASVDASLAAQLGPERSIADFTSRWSDRLRGQTDIGGLTLDEYLQRDALPAAIAAEGYHDLDPGLQHCLAAALYDELVAIGAPGFPHPSLTPDAAKGALFAFVFDNQWVKDLEDTPEDAPPTPGELPSGNLSGDQRLTALELPAPPATPSAAPGANPVQLVFQTVDQIVSGLLTQLGTLFTNLGAFISQLGLPIPFPPLPLPTIDPADVVNLARLLLSATTYRVCYTGGKWGSSQRCGALPFVMGLDLPVPLGTIVPVDVAGDARPDFMAQLTLRIGGGVGYQWLLTRVSPALSGVSGPIAAHVFAIFRAPTNPLELSVGSDGTASTLADTSRYTFTLTDPIAAAQGEINLAARIVHRNPGPKSGMSFGARPVTADDGVFGTSTSPTFDTGTLNFSPVPALVSAPFGADNGIEAAIQLKSGDFDSDTKPDSRVKVALTMPQTGVVLDARVVSKYAAANGGPCCPLREIVSTVNALPTSATVVVDSFPAKRITDATYDANTSIGQVDLAVREFPQVTGDHPTGAQANTFSRLTAKVLQIPTHVHVRYTSPDPALAAKTTVVHYDASASIPHAEFGSQQWANDVATGGSALQRRLSFKADTIPSVIDLTNTTTEVSTRNSTGNLSYQANGSVTNVALDVEDVIGVSALQATVASLPKAISASYDLEQPGDTNPLTPGFEDPGHTIVHADGRNLLTDPAGSAPFGVIDVKLRSRVSAFLVVDPTIASEEHAVVNMDPRTATTPLDDTAQVDLRYSGLRALDLEVMEDGRIGATIRNDAEKRFIAQVAKPDLRLAAEIDKLPKQVSFSRTLVGGLQSHQHLTYTGCTPSGSSCTPKKIDSVKVRIDGVIPASAVPTGAPKPALLAGEHLDTTITDVPSKVDVDLDTPDVGKQAITYDGAERTGSITAALHKAVDTLGTIDLAAVVLGVPTHFDATYGKDLPIVFTSGAGQAIDRVSAVVTNTGTAMVPATFTPHAAVTYIETPNTLPTLQASVGLNNLQAFSFDSGAGGGTFTGSIQTAAVSPNPNNPFTLTANVRSLATDAGGSPINDLNKATVIRTGSGGAVLKPLPTKIVISKTGGVQTNGTDTSTLTIDTTGSAEKAELVGDVAIGGPDGVIDALAESLPALQGVHVGDGSATGETNAIRLVLSLPATPTKSIVRYGQITSETALPANPPASFDVSGFGTMPGNKLSIGIDLDDTPLDDRMHALIEMGGVGPALGFLQLSPIAIVPNAEDDLDLEVRASVGANAGPLDLDLRFGESAVGGAARPTNRIVVHTDVLPPGVLFRAKLGVAVAPDLANFHAEFRDTGGGLTGSPGHTTVQYQTPAEDGIDLVDNPPSKVSLDLKDVPSKIDFTVKTAASIKKGNPNETCGLKESDFVLPTLTYTSDGSNESSLDAAVKLDLAFIEPGSPVVTLDIVDLADGFTITNTDEGETYNLGNPGGITGKVRVDVRPFDVKLVDLDWTGCPDSTDFISWNGDGRATVAIKPDNLGLEINGLQQVELKPGFSTGVSGTFTDLSLALPNPLITVTFAHNFAGGIKLRLSDDIQGTIPVFSVPNGTLAFPLPVVFHVAKHEAGPWIDIFTGIPCPLPPFFLHAVANIEPHRTALSLNAFTVTNGTWTVTADPFGVSAGISMLFGIDLIDTIAGLFTSPYSHGLRAPSLSCEFL